MNKRIFLGLVAAAAFSSPLHAQVKQSQGIKDAISLQAKRTQEGDKDLSAFRADLERLARNRDPVAQFLLAPLLMSKEPERATKLFKESAERGCAGAAGLMAIESFAKNDPAAKGWLDRAITGGDATSMLAISTFHWRGDHGYPKSLPQSLAWAKLAKDRTNSKTMTAFIDAFSQDRQKEMSREQIYASDILFKELEHQYPKKAFYLCGQSTP